jgi:hypothetical protein
MFRKGYCLLCKGLFPEGVGDEKMIKNRWDNGKHLLSEPRIGRNV